MSEDPNRPEVDVRAPGDARFAIVWSRFNKAVVKKLLDGALECFDERGAPAESVYVVEVPGAWELPYAANKLATSGRFDAVVVGGSIERFDPRFVHALNPGGRLFVVVGSAPTMEARLVTRSTEADWTSEVLFETVLKPLENGTLPPEFLF